MSEETEAPVEESSDAAAPPPPPEHTETPNEAGGTGAEINLESLLDVPVTLSVEIGRSRVSIRELVSLNQGSVIELDRKIGEPIDLMINDRTVARGDLVKVNGDFIGVALREIVKDLVPSSL